MKFTGQVLDIGSLQEFKTNNSEIPLLKRMIHLKLHKKESVFFEVRNKYLPQLQSPDPIIIGDTIEVDIVFLGSSKNGIKFNNLLATKITKL